MTRTGPYAARLAGEQAPKHPDKEQTIDKLKARIQSVLEYASTFKPSDYEGADTRPFTGATETVRKPTGRACERAKQARAKRDGGRTLEAAAFKVERLCERANAIATGGGAP